MAQQSPQPILVVGSCNADYLIGMPVLPMPGETTLAHGLEMSCGGKGANQAVAAARLGAQVSMVGAVGDDEDGSWLLRELRAEGVEVSGIEVHANADTGRAFVWVDDAGENMISVVPGANFALSASRVRHRVQAAPEGTVLVLQAEIPTDVIHAAVRASDGTRAVINLAPATELATDVIARADPLVLNESEASVFTGREICTPAEVFDALSNALVPPRSAVVTLGAAGAVWVDGDDWGHIPAPGDAHVVDTTGAGDAFVGAMASSLAAGQSIAQATVLAVRAGTYSVSLPGAQSSYARLSDLT